MGILGGLRGSTIQKYWKAGKQLDQSVPNLAPVYRLILESTLSEQINSSRSQGALWGGGALEGQKFENVEKLPNDDQSGSNYTYVC